MRNRANRDDGFQLQQWAEEKAQKKLTALTKVEGQTVQAVLDTGSVQTLSRDDMLPNTAPPGKQPIKKKIHAWRRFYVSTTKIESHN